MYNHIQFILCFLILCHHVSAQRKCVVLDMETRVPVRDVVVRLIYDTSMCASLDSLGSARGHKRVTSHKTRWDGVVDVDTLAQSIELSRSGYMERKMELSEVTDTIELLPSFNALTDVVVWGKYRPRGMTFSLTPSSDAVTLPDPGKSASVSVDLLGGIERLFTYKKRKRAKKVKDILDNY